MNNLKSTVFVALSFIFMFLVSVTVAKAQCVECAPSPPDGWICVPTTVGGGGCKTKGSSCTVILVCSGGTDLSGQKCAVKNLDQPQINISDSIVREVGNVNPLAAIALINIRDIKMEFRDGKTKIAPIDFSTSDVESYLTQPESSDYFHQITERASKAFAVKKQPVVYDFVVNTTENGAVLILKRDGDPKSSVEIGLADTAVKGSGASKFEATSWKIN